MRMQVDQFTFIKVVNVYVVFSINFFFDHDITYFIDAVWHKLVKGET